MAVQGKDGLAERAKKITQASKKKVKGAPPSKQSGANDTPARRRYWGEGRLEKRKIRNLMVHCGMSYAVASTHWHANRKGRIKK